MKTDVDQVTIAAIEDTIFGLLATRKQGATICPSDVARALVADEAGWRRLMPHIRQAADGLARDSRISITRRGTPVDATSPGGPIRLGLPITRKVP